MCGQVKVPLIEKGTMVMVAPLFESGLTIYGMFHESNVPDLLYSSCLFMYDFRHVEL